MNYLELHSGYSFFLVFILLLLVIVATSFELQVPLAVVVPFVNAVSAAGF
jgi:hypothetical protein